MKLLLNFRSGIAPLTLDLPLDEEEVLETIKKAILGQEILDLTDTRGERVLIPAQNIAYAQVPSKQSTPVGFGRA